MKLGAKRKLRFKPTTNAMCQQATLIGVDSYFADSYTLVHRRRDSL